MLSGLSSHDNEGVASHLVPPEGQLMREHVMPHAVTTDAGAR